MFGERRLENERAIVCVGLFYLFSSITTFSATFRLKVGKHCQCVEQHNSCVENHYQCIDNALSTHVDNALSKHVVLLLPTLFLETWSPFPFKSSIAALENLVSLWTSVFPLVFPSTIVFLRTVTLCLTFVSH